MLHVEIRKRLDAEGRGTFTLDLNFDAPADGVTILFGPSGSGKTTTLRAVAGIITPDEGRITLGDQIFFDSTRRVNFPIQRRRVGFVFQDYALFPHFTAEQNVAFGLQDSGGKTRSARAREWLAQLRIEEAAGRYPRELSGGEQQRVAVARALASGPSVMLLDEPLAAVDAATRSKLLSEITALQQQARIPFLYVTHNHAEALRIGQHLILMHAGRVVQTGTPDEVFHRPANAQAAHIVGTENIFPGRIVAHREAEGITLIDLGDGGCRVAATYNELPPGAPVTVGVRAEDIIIARERVTQTSAHNVLSATIKRQFREAGRVELIAESGGVDFKVSITAGTVETLNLAEGTSVYLLIKARAFYLL
ncbi:ABC transporter ATP-binding protein [soil metagenome]